MLIKYLKIVTIVYTAFFLETLSCLPLPFDEYAYVLARNELESVNDHSALLSNKEQVVSIFLEKIKLDEFADTLSNFFPARTIETELKKILNRDLYNQLKRLPKGGNLHMHEFQMLDRTKFLEMVFALPEYEYLHICDKGNDPICAQQPASCNCKSFDLRYFKVSAPHGWIRVKGSNWTIEEIVGNTTLTNILNSQKEKVYATDTGARWALANNAGVFSFYQSLRNYNNTRFNYLKACLDSALAENVQVVEFRRGAFGTLFYFDDEGNEMPISDVEELRMLEQFKAEYLANNPRLIDFVFIIYGYRLNSREIVMKDVQTAISLASLYPDLIRGYDLVGEEDAGHTLLFQRDSLIEGFNFSQVSKDAFNLVLHTAETSWPGDLPTNDEGATLSNAYDAILLKTKRIGHGLGLIKTPSLYQYLIKRKIAVEVCPASNQILGYMSDLRNHPAINYYKSGIPIVIAGDDPGSFGYNELTVDYYMIFMAWGLDLYDMREIANNSVRYSLMPENKRREGFAKFGIEWNTFINETHKTACSGKSVNSKALNVRNVLPSYGPNDRSIEITLLGKGFESLICKNFTCVFDQVRTSGRLHKIDQILCRTPQRGFIDNQVASIFIQLENGESIDTHSQFKFKNSKYLNVVEDNIDISNKSTKPMTFSYTIYLFFLLSSFIEY